jgi:ABC-type uncharacterized transport system permease subunit
MSKKGGISRVLLGLAFLLMGIAFLGSRDARNDTFAVHVYTSILYALACLLGIVAGVKDFIDRRQK